MRCIQQLSSLTTLHDVSCGREAGAVAHQLAAEYARKALAKTQKKLHANAANLPKDP